MPRRPNALYCRLLLPQIDSHTLSSRLNLAAFSVRGSGGITGKTAQSSLGPWSLLSGAAGGVAVKPEIKEEPVEPGSKVIEVGSEALACWESAQRGGQGSAVTRAVCACGAEFEQRLKCFSRDSGIHMKGHASCALLRCMYTGEALFCTHTATNPGMGTHAANRGHPEPCNLFSLKPQCM